MSFIRVEARVFVLGKKKPIAKFNFDETTIGQVGDLVAFVQKALLGFGR